MRARSWNEYKKTMGDPSLFDFARSGDLRGLANLLTINPELDLNQKNHKGYSALMLAVYNGQDDFAEALLRAGVDANSSDGVGNSILMGAAFKGKVKLLSLLIKYGADPRLKNHTNMLAYDWAKMFGRADAMRYFEETFDFHQKDSSKVKNILRFMNLGLMMVRLKFKSST